MGKNDESRKRHQEETLITATNHRQPWGSDEDAVIMEHNYVTGTLVASFQIGRTFEAVKHRRYLLRLHLKERYIPTPPTKPLTLQEACEERAKQLAAGVELPTIVQVPGDRKSVV